MEWLRVLHVRHYANSLHAFADHKTIFPIDEREIVAMQRLPDAEVLRFVELRLGPAYSEEFRLIHRQYELKTGRAKATTEEDQMLVRAIGIYDWITECSIVIQQPGLAFTPLGRRKKLVTEYQAAREAWRSTLTDRLTLSAP